MVLLIIALLVGVGIGWMLAGKKAASAAPAMKDVTPVAVAPAALEQTSVLKPEWLAALGGQANVRVAEFIASTRVRVEMLDGGKMDEAKLQVAGIAAIARINPQTVHLIM